MPLGTKAGLDKCHVVLDGDLAPEKGRTAAPALFGACLMCPQYPISATAELFNCYQRAKVTLLFSREGFYVIPTHHKQPSAYDIATTIHIACYEVGAVHKTPCYKGTRAQ